MGLRASRLRRAGSTRARNATCTEAAGLILAKFWGQNVATRERRRARVPQPTGCGENDAAIMMKMVKRLRRHECVRYPPVWPAHPACRRCEGRCRHLFGRCAAEQVDHQCGQTILAPHAMVQQMLPVESGRGGDSSQGIASAVATASPGRGEQRACRAGITLTGNKEALRPSSQQLSPRLLPAVSRHSLANLPSVRSNRVNTCMNAAARTSRSLDCGARRAAFRLATRSTGA